MAPGSVIPDLTRACPGPRIESGAGPIRGIHVHRNETTEDHAEISKAAVARSIKPATPEGGALLAMCLGYGISFAGTSTPISLRYLMAPGCSGIGEYLAAFSGVVYLAAGWILNR